MKFAFLSIALLCLIGCGHKSETEVIDVDPQNETVDVVDVDTETDVETPADSSNVIIQDGAIESIEGRNHDRKKPDRHHRHDEAVDPNVDPQPDQKPGEGETVENRHHNKEVDRNKKHDEHRDKADHNKSERAKRWGDFCGHFTGAANSWGGGGILGLITWPFSLAAAFLKFIAFVAYWFFILLVLAFVAAMIFGVYLFYTFVRWCFTPSID